MDKTEERVSDTMKNYYYQVMDFRQMRALMKDNFHQLSKDKQKEEKANGFKLNLDYNRLVDYYRKWHKEGLLKVRSFHHYKLMDNIHPLYDVCKSIEDDYERDQKKRAEAKAKGEKYDWVAEGIKEYNLKKYYGKPKK